MASALVTIGAVSCKQGASTSAPKTQKDSMAVAMAIVYGNQMNQQFEMSRAQGMAIDSIEFLRGFKEGLKDSTKFSYFAGGVTAGNMGRQIIQQDSLDADVFYASFYNAVLNDTTKLAMTVAQAQEYMQKASEIKRAKEMKERFGHNITEGKEYMAQFEKEEGVQKTASGLAYKVLTPGTGAMPVATDSVTVKYVGTFTDGKEFDKSETPVTFAADGVIKGWTEMLQLMKEGEKVKVVIPQELAYGDKGMGMEPYKTLVFEIELIKVIKPKAAK